MKTTLILIHGYPFDHTLWDFVKADLGNKIALITPDLPGFGDNPVAPDEPSIDFFAGEIARLFELHHLQRAVVAGMSMGGYVALSFAERYPKKLSGLGLISTQACADTTEARQGRRQMIEKIKKEGSQLAAAAAIPKLFAPANLENKSLLKFPQQGAEKAGVAGICWALEAMARRPDRISLLPQLQIPTLVLHGIEDKFIPVDSAREMARQIPNAEFIEVSGAGHASPIEAPKIVAEALRRLCQRGEDFEIIQSKHEKPADNRPGIIVSPTELGL
ncbi:MAG: alpha/beta fold hydrolase [Limisphaerales bacterium]